MNKPTSQGYYRFRGNHNGVNIGWLIGYFDGRAFHYDERNRDRDLIKHHAYLSDLAGEWDGPLSAEPSEPLPCGHPIECQRAAADTVPSGVICGWCKDIQEYKDDLLTALELAIRERAIHAFKTQTGRDRGGDGSRMSCDHPVVCLQVSDGNSDLDRCGWCEEVGQLKARLDKAEEKARKYDELRK